MKIRGKNFRSFKLSGLKEVESVFNDYGNSNANIIVSQSVSETMWIHLIEGKASVENISHPLVVKVVNDTGSGGAFAGGFIFDVLTSHGSKTIEHAIHSAMVSAAKRLVNPTI